MARRYNPSQVRSKLRQIQNKQRQAINRYNSAVRRHNQNVRTAVNKYNQAVRAHNARVRANRQRLKTELARLSRQTTSTRHVTFRTSVNTMQQAYSRLDQHADSRSRNPEFNYFVDLSEREAANAASVANALLGETDEQQQDQLDVAPLGNALAEISPELHDRWTGAVFALNPANPDAARHFCTSAREIFTQVLEISAPDDDVRHLLQDCAFTDQGRPTRRSKVRFLLQKKQLMDQALEDFVDADIDNVVELFRVFNDGTHGSAGTFDHAQLGSIRKRVEDGIMFLTQIAAPVDA